MACSKIPPRHASRWKCFVNDFAFTNFLAETNVPLWFLWCFHSYPKCSCPTQLYIFLLGNLITFSFATNPISSIHIQFIKFIPKCCYHSKT